MIAYLYCNCHCHNLTFNNTRLTFGGAISMSRMTEKEIMPNFYEEASIRVYPNNNLFYQPNSDCFSPHWHDWMEILYVIQGSITAYVNQKSITANPGSAVIFFPGQLHYATAGNEGAKYRIIMFNPASFYNRTDASNRYLVSMLNHKESYSNFTDKTEIIQCINDLISFYNGASELLVHPMIVVGELYKMMAYIMESNLLASNVKRNAIDAHIMEIIQYINEHINEPMTTTSLSTILGYETSYFIRLFKKNVFMTPREYIRSIRLEKARDIIMTTSLPIKEIAERCGFENLSYFSRAFHEAYRISPSACRNEASKKKKIVQSSVYL